ncbi:MAG: flagellar hook capping FlgD N-terminal domain-containing protein [Algisphaera sp.]
MSALANLNPALSAPAAGSAAEAAANSGNPYAELKSTDFVKIMVTELSNQDPFEPNDSAAILEQLSSLRSIESDLSLQSQLESLVLQNAIGQAGALIGREAEGLSLDNETIQGTVTSVRVVDGKTEVELDTGRRLPLKRITRVAGEAPSPIASVPVPAASETVVPEVKEPVASTADASSSDPIPVSEAESVE